MAFQDQYPSGSDLPRSLSDQLRILEEQLNRLSDNGPVQLVHPAREPLGLPTVLGRPIGLAAPPRAPMLGAPERYGDEDGEHGAPARQRTFRRRVTIAGVSLLLLSSTAVIPSLWHFAVPETVEQATPPALSLRTEQFANAARELGQARLVEAAPAESAPTSVPHTAAPAPSRGGRELSPQAVAPPVATLTVAESDLARLSLPMLVSGGGRAWAGSAVVIDGLPAEARVSHGMKIAPDTWTVGIADVGHAVLSLPRTTPDRLELSVRVVAADSHELAASALRIQVLRSPDRPAQLTPTAVFEPAAADTGPGREIDPGPQTRQAVKVNRTKRPVLPASPVKPSPTQTAKQEEWPTATSAWVTEERKELPTFGFAPMPKWAPFSDR